MLTHKKLLFFFVSLIITLSACNTEKVITPILPMEDFFRNPEKTNFQLSPEGEYISFLQPWQNRLNIYVQPVKGDSARRITNSSLRDIQMYYWTNNNQLVYLQDDRGDDNYQLYIVDKEGENEKALTPFNDTKVMIVDNLDEMENEIIISMNKRDKRFFDVYRVNLQNGDYKMIALNPGNVTRWFTDNRGYLRLAVTTDGVNQGLLYRKNEADEFKLIKSTNFKETLEPLFFSFDDNYIYASSNLGRDKQAIILYDPETNSEIKTIFEDEEFDVSDLLRSREKQIITGVTFITWKKQYKFFDKERELLQQDLETKLPGYEVTIVTSSRDENKLLIRTHSDKSLGAYYYYNPGSEEFFKLAEVSPWLDENNMADMKPIRYKARDGRTIYGYLTLPKGVEPKELPVVINPHGGPWIRDTWGFNKESQFFANRGYAVLQMNYRGSKGYGKEFWEAGFKEWGGKIQDDITDGVNWLIRQEIADPRRIAIYGASFGGYAALCGVTFTPDLYTCGISYVGIPDVTQFLNTIPPYWEPFKKMLYEMVGDVKTDSLMLKEISPFYSVDKIKVPLLIAQGSKDQRVDKNITDRFVETLKKQGVDVEYMVKEDEGHGFRNEENRFEFYRRMEKFLMKNLGR